MKYEQAVDPDHRRIAFPWLVIRIQHHEMAPDTGEYGLISMYGTPSDPVTSEPLQHSDSASRLIDRISEQTT
jgi:hypothetical protein